MTTSRLLAIVALLALLVPGTTWADDLGCLTKTNGRVVKWDKDWQPDLSDHDVRYLVTSYNEKKSPGQPAQYILNLRAQGSAAKKERTATIVKSIAAGFFCKRIEGGLDDKTRGVQVALGGRDAARGKSYEIASFYPVSDLDPTQLSFRRWNGSAWIPANPDADQELFICYSRLGPVACSHADWELSKGGIPKLPPLRLELPGAFIRSTGGLWFLEDPIGDYEEAEVGICPLFGRNFYCLANEKTKFAKQLIDTEKAAVLSEQQYPLSKPPAIAKAKKVRAKK